ncbi:hypothetical protein PhCBS80983_g03158 [Powellomyces hirtus]|uniref:Peptide hydrolase n=1 Tax=Powellomyces hirtus TaxID=109895 RepID=A0A507E5I1_9FUNG|nr:hypothetical protein PhCBS80983_g03158 [Powellomyces hirtus]
MPRQPSSPTVLSSASSSSPNSSSIPLLHDNYAQRPPSHRLARLHRIFSQLRFPRPIRHGWTRVSSHPLAARTVQTIAVCVFLVSFSLAVKWAAGEASMPRAIVLRNDTDAFSGAAAWRHLENIVRYGPRPYNSESNLDVQKLIVQRLRDVGRVAVRNGKSEDWLEVAEDDTVNVIIKESYFESNNIVVRIRGKSASRSALLISAHYDSTPLSFGVTDDGIAISVMIELVRSLAYAPQLDGDVMLVFTNAEEVGLLGGHAFVRHPWFGDVKAFINLEGTGAAGATRSLLFRTNSYDMVRAFADAAPYPHASVLADDLMSIIHSDTDYTPLTTFGKLPGIDIAFYAQRYFYHSLKDDLEHAEAICAQYMGDNLLATVAAVCGSSFLTAKLADFDAANEQLAMDNGNFVYYDFLGRRMVVTTAAMYKTGMSLLLVAVAIGTGMKAVAESRRYGFKRVVKRYIKPIAEAYLLVLLTFASTLTLTALLSKLKSWLNSASTFGNPHYNLAWIVAAVGLVMLQMQTVWPWIALRMRLRKAPVVVYNLLPTADRFEEEDDEANVRARGGGESPGMDVDDSDVEGMDSGHESQEEDDDHLPMRRGTGARSSKAEVPAGPSLHVWIPYGLLCFWWSTLFLALALSHRRLMSAYLIYDFAFFSALAVVFTVVIGAVIRKWWRADIASEQGGLPMWKQRAVWVFERYAWVGAMVVSSFIPSLGTFDILSMLLYVLPTLIAEGLPEVGVDVVIATLITMMGVNLMPALNRSRIHRPSLVLIAGAIFVPLYLLSIWSFPFSDSRPQKLGFYEMWDVTDGAVARTSHVRIAVAPTMSATKWADKSSRAEESDFVCVNAGDAPPPAAGLPRSPNGVCKFHDSEPPVVRDPTTGRTTEWSNMITLHGLTHDAVKGTLSGSFTGPPHSRSCTVQITATAAAAQPETNTADETTAGEDAEQDKAETPDLHLWLNPHQTWSYMDGTQAIPGNASSIPTLPSPPTPPPPTNDPGSGEEGAETATIRPWAAFGNAVLRRADLADALAGSARGLMGGVAVVKYVD